MLYFFAWHYGYISYKESIVLQDSSFKKICMDLNNFPSDPKLLENVSSFHSN